MEKEVKLNPGVSLELKIGQFGIVPDGISYADGVVYGGKAPEVYTLNVITRIGSPYWGFMIQRHYTDVNIPTNEGELIVEDVTPEHIILKYIERNNQN